ncbi:MAG: hypothetical protein HDS66_03435 [Bacteroidales bacterium]|nr:hypothetical protein [Bacteroidales bacterium]
MIYPVEMFKNEIIAENILSGCKMISNRKEKIRYIKIGCGFDIETSKIMNISYDNKGNSIETIIGSYCYHWQFSCGGNYIVGRYLFQIQYFFRALIEKIRGMGNDIRLLVWDANLGYEWQFCKKYFYDLGITQFFCKEIRNPLKFTLGGCIEFRECIGLLGHSLKDIAKKYTQSEKAIGDLDYDSSILSKTVMTDKEINYCIVDVKILAEMGEWVFKNYYGKNSCLPLTSTGFIRNKIKNRIGRRLKAIRHMTQMHLPDEEDFYFLRKWGFKGGICGTNIAYIGQVLEGITCADLTSDYPAQMLHEKFPMGFCMRCDPSKFMSEDRPYIAQIIFHNLKQNTSHALYSSSKCVNVKELDEKNCILDNGRICYAQKAEFVLTDIEMDGFNKAYSYDDDFEIVKCWQFDEYGYLPDYVKEVILEEYLKKKKLKGTPAEETQEYMDAKAFVNGIFGMFATALFPYEKILKDTPDCIVEPSPSKKSFKDVTEKLFLSPFWAFWVTSYARNILIDVITKFPDAIVQYDTDSVYYRLEYSMEVTEYLKKYNTEIEKINEKMYSDLAMRDLGCWSIDPPSLRFKALGAKRYIYETNKHKMKIVVCGCRKGTIQEMIKSEYLKKGLQLTDSELNDQIFERFENALTIDETLSGKLASSYIDDEIETDYIDRDGNKEHIIIKSCVILKPVAFSMKMHKLHLQLANEYASLDALAKNSRILEIMEKRGIRFYKAGMPIDHVEKKRGKKRGKRNEN